MGFGQLYSRLVRVRLFPDGERRHPLPADIRRGIGRARCGVRPFAPATRQRAQTCAALVPRRAKTAPQFRADVVLRCRPDSSSRALPILFVLQHPHRPSRDGAGRRELVVVFGRRRGSDHVLVCAPIVPAKGTHPINGHLVCVEFSALAAGVDSLQRPVNGGVANVSCVYIRVMLRRLHSVSRKKRRRTVARNRPRALRGDFNGDGRSARAHARRLDRGQSWHLRRVSNCRQNWISPSHGSHQPHRGPKCSARNTLERDELPSEDSPPPIAE